MAKVFLKMDLKDHDVARNIKGEVDDYRSGPGQSGTETLALNCSITKVGKWAGYVQEGHNVGQVCGVDSEVSHQFSQGPRVIQVKGRAIV